MQFIIWIIGAVSAFRLWEDIRWLAVVAIVLTLSYGTHGNEKEEYERNGEYSDSTATRLMITTVLLVGILIYSFFV